MYCERCTAKEGSKHPFWGYKVELEKLKVNKTNTNLCQRCKARIINEANNKASKIHKKSTLNFFKKIFS